MENKAVVLAIFSVALAGLALARWYYMDKSIQHIDSVLIGLVVSAFIIHLLPFDRLTSIKAGGIEFTLDKTEINERFGFNANRIFTPFVAQYADYLQSSGDFYDKFISKLPKYRYDASFVKNILEKHLEICLIRKLQF